MFTIKEIKITESIELVRDTNIKVLKAKNSKAIKIKLFYKFCNNRTKLRSYLFQLNIYIYLNSLKFRIIEKCILFAAFYLKEEVYKWFKPYFTDYINYISNNRR